ncbi:MAG: NADP-dependent phosphogluconate dehydrogenase [Chloroflexi bacterium]|nr:NADP-dependent phosphogluconate dehydrogenase [Chloroflexota bacterium]
MSTCDIGVYGLAVMGQNLALNLADHDNRVAVYNRTEAKTREFVDQKVDGKPVEAAYELDAFVGLLKKPRVILLMLKAGGVLDTVIDQLLPHLEAGDIIMDGGNSHFTDTERRAEMLAARNIHYIGLGVSGGEEGARHGPSLMPGGTQEAYARVQAMLEAVAAEAEGEPCVTYLGPRGSGHYVKMVHNGIEYAIMQAIAEIYDVLKRAAGMSPAQMSDVFRRWNEGPLSSFLVEITANVLAYVEPETGQALVDLILDRAQQKGTGKWTTQDALDLGVPVPTISTAVDARIISALKAERQHAASILQGPSPRPDGAQDQLVQDLEGALLATEICAYAQGFVAMRAASAEYNYNLNMADIAHIWRNGCIIRAAMLNEMRQAFGENNDLPNLMIAPHFASVLAARQTAWRNVVGLAVQSGIPTPSLSSALAYYDSYRTARLPANLIQAQRDYFGAHTYERIDKAGEFHTEWQGN